MEDEKYYVYAHLTPDENKIFYIGSGKGHRVIECGKNRSLNWKNVVYLKKGFNFKFLAENLTKKEALKIEMDYIKKIGLENLANIIGEGGNKCTFKKGSIPWNKGMKMKTIYNTKKVEYNNIVFNSVDEAISSIGIGKTTFYRWVKKGKVKYV